MSESVPSSSGEPRDTLAAKSTTVSTGKRSGGWFVGLLAIAALLLGAYLYYRLVFIGKVEQMPGQVEQLSQSLDEQIRSADLGVLQRVESDLVPKIEQAAGQARDLEQRLLAIESAVAGLLAADADRGAPPDMNDWKVAEVGYLLRIANHRLVMERSTQDAQLLLASADAILAEMGDMRWHAVREQIAVERLALDQAQGGVDIQGVYLALEALKAPLGEILVTLPELAISPAPASPPAGASIWEVLMARLTDVFRIHRVDTSVVKPLLTNAEQHYLEQQMRLAIEQAQLGALRRQQAVFVTSLGNIRRLLDAGIAEDSQALSEMKARIEVLEKTQLEVEIPDISGSLQAFNDARQGTP